MKLAELITLNEQLLVELDESIDAELELLTEGKLKDLFAKVRSAAKGPVAKSLLMALVLGATAMSANASDAVASGGVAIKAAPGKFDSKVAVQQALVKSPAGKNALKVLGDNGVHLDGASIMKINNYLQGGKKLNDPSIKSVIKSHVDSSTLMGQISNMLDTMARAGA